MLGERKLTNGIIQRYAYQFMLCLKFPLYYKDQSAFMRVGLSGTFDKSNPYCKDIRCGKIQRKCGIAKHRRPPFRSNPIVCTTTRSNPIEPTMTQTKQLGQCHRFQIWANLRHPGRVDFLRFLQSLRFPANPQIRHHNKTINIQFLPSQGGFLQLQRYF